MRGCSAVALQFTKTLPERGMINGCDILTQRSTLAPAGIGSEAAAVSIIAVYARTSCFRTNAPAPFEMRRLGFVSLLEVCLSR